MRSHSINIPSADKLKELVRIVNQFLCDVNLKNGAFTQYDTRNDWRGYRL